MLYLSKPLLGLATALSHIFQSLNHDYFFTYIHNRNPWFSVPINFLGHTTLFAAAITAVRLTRQRQITPATVFALIVVFITISINSVSVPEPRFGMLVYLVAGPAAIWGMITLQSAMSRASAILASTLYGTGATALSLAMIPAELIGAAG